MPDVSLKYTSAVINRAKRKATVIEEADTGVDGGMEDGADRNHPPRSRHHVRRPKQGELLWYNTGIEVDGDGGRSRIYGWSEVGGEIPS